MDSIKDLKIIPKPHYNIANLGDKELIYKAYAIFEQLRWNDPREDQVQPFDISFRGGNIKYFNEQVLLRFLEKSGQNRIIRSHESSRGGFANLFNGKLIHVFSAEPYFNKVPQGYILHEKSDGKTILRDLDFKIVKIL